MDRLGYEYNPNIKNAIRIVKPTTSSGLSLHALAILIRHT